jgi:hypothetical protein
VIVCAEALHAIVPIVLSVGAALTVNVPLAAPPSGFVSVKLLLPVIPVDVKVTVAVVAETTVAFATVPPELTEIVAPETNPVPVIVNVLVAPAPTDGEIETIDGADFTVRLIVSEPVSGFVMVKVREPAVTFDV